MGRCRKGGAPWFAGDRGTAALVGIGLAILLCACLPVDGLAQTCINPLALPLNGELSGDTCTAPNSLPGFGPVPSPQRDVVHRIDPWAQEFTATLSGSSDVQLLLLPRCAQGADPIAATMTQIDGGRLRIPAGTGSTRYLVVTGDSSQLPETCGAYRLATATDPDSGRGTCSNPLPIGSDGVENGESICDYPLLSLDLEGLALSRAGVVYRLDSSALSRPRLEFSESGLQGVALVTRDCASAPLAGVRLDSGDRSIDLSGLPGGDYRLIVADATTSGARDCGGYQFTDGHQRYLVEPDRFQSRVQPGAYDESFSDVAEGTHPSLDFSGDGFSYRLSGTGQASAGLRSSTGRIDVVDPTEGLRIEFTGEPVTAVGAILFAMRPMDYRRRSALRVILDDGTEHRFMMLPQLPFRGFITESPIASMVIETESDHHHLGVDRLIVGRAR